MNILEALEAPVKNLTIRRWLRLDTLSMHRQGQFGALANLVVITGFFTSLILLGCMGFQYWILLFIPVIIISWKICGSYFNEVRFKKREEEKEAAKEAQVAEEAKSRRGSEKVALKIPEYRVLEL